jgi:hypothetical protein
VVKCIHTVEGRQVPTMPLPGYRSSRVRLPIRTKTFVPAVGWSAYSRRMKCSEEAPSVAAEQATAAHFLRMRFSIVASAYCLPQSEAWYIAFKNMTVRPAASSKAN